MNETREINLVRRLVPRDRAGPSFHFGIVEMSYPKPFGIRWNGKASRLYGQAWVTWRGDVG